MPPVYSLVNTSWNSGIYIIGYVHIIMFSCIYVMFRYLYYYLMKIVPISSTSREVMNKSLIELKIVKGQLLPRN